MKIRSITFFLDPALPTWNHQLKKAATLSRDLIKEFQKIGLETQTTRLASPPMHYWITASSIEEIVRLVKQLESSAKDAGFSYFSTGPATTQSTMGMQSLLPILKETSAFTACQLDDCKGKVSLEAIRTAAQVIQESAKLENGFANLRFAALSRVQPGTPFFPAAYGQPNQAAFSIAMQAADIAQQCLENAQNLQSGLNTIIQTFDFAASRMQTVLDTLPASLEFTFLGFDFSPAPFPDANTSLGAALEAIGVPMLGLPGSLGCAALLAASLDEGKWKKVGFNGLMLPVLEDAVLARRSLEGNLTVRDLLLFSAVCGAGLDTVPLPGDITSGQIEAVLWDVAVLAQRLNKPLTARLMPLPGKKTGDAVDFNFEFFARGGVMALEMSSLRRGLKESNSILVRTRSVREQSPQSSS